MVFVIPRSPLTPGRELDIRIDPACKVVRAADLSTLREAGEAMERARRHADQLMAQADAAYEAERQRGYQEGREEARLEHATQMIENVTRNVEFFASVETRMVDLVIQSIQRILADFDDRERVLATVRNVLSVVRNQKQMTLRLAPDRVDLVKSGIQQVLADYPGIGFLDIVADSRLVDDACILESEIGVVEASLDTQVAALRAAFLKVLGSRTS